VFSALAAFSPERFVTLFAALVAPDKRELRYVNAGHPPSLLWRGLRDFTWLESTGPLVSPALPASAWEVLVVPIDQYDQLLLYTDGVSDVLADADGGAETRIRTTVERDWAGGARLLDSILADVQHDLAGRPQPDDLTLLTVRLLPR
jgi:sigma-B regulation protein RsbU (phosphoserine phosphatase)